MKLCINIETERVRIGRLELTGQWVDFYALLLVSRTGSKSPSAFLTAEQLSRVGPWRHKAASSVGKEVARHLTQLDNLGLGDVVEWQGRTQSWRLGTAVGPFQALPDDASVRAWLTARSLGDALDDGSVQDLKILVEGALVLQRGDAGSTMTKLGDLSHRLYDVEPALEAWSALLRGRALHQHCDEEDDALDALYEEWSRRRDPLGKAVNARFRAQAALKRRFDEPAPTMASLVKLAAELERRGDIGTLGAVINAIGILARRAGASEVGAAHHLRAAALFGIVGDYPLLQAAVFNLAIDRREELRRRGRPPDESLLALVELAKLIAARCGVGDDSAQAEIAGAQWTYEMGDV